MKKMKMLTAALACVMTMSIMAPCSAYALDAPATEGTSTEASSISTNGLEENTDKIISGLTDLVNSDDKLKGFIKCAESAAGR